MPHRGVHKAFGNSVVSSPDSIAAVFAQISLSYEQLHDATKRLANVLLESGTQPRQRVFLVVSRSLELLVGIFAILKPAASTCQLMVASRQTKQFAFTLVVEYQRTATDREIPKAANRKSNRSNESKMLELLTLVTTPKKFSQR